MPWVNRVHRLKEFVGLRDLWLKRMSGLSGVISHLLFNATSWNNSPTEEQRGDPLEWFLTRRHFYQLQHVAGYSCAFLTLSSYEFVWSIGMPHTQIEQVHSEHACINKTRTAFLLRSRSNVKSKCTCHCQSFSTYSRVVQEYRSAHRRVQSFLLLNNRDLSWIAFYHSYKLLQRLLLKCLRICWTY